LDGSWLGIEIWLQAGRKRKERAAKAPPGDRVRSFRFRRRNFFSPCAGQVNHEQMQQQCGAGLDMQNPGGRGAMKEEMTKSRRAWAKVGKIPCAQSPDGPRKPARL